MFMIKRQSREAREQSSEQAKEKLQTWKDGVLGDGLRFDLPLHKRGKRNTRKELEHNPHP